MDRHGTLNRAVWHQDVWSAFTERAGRVRESGKSEDVA